MIKQPTIGAKISEKQLTTFFASLALTGVVKNACYAANINRKLIYSMREAREDIARRWQEALDSARDEIEAEVVRRGKEGWLEPMVVAGKVVYYPENQPPAADGTPLAGSVMMVRKFSDKLLETYHKGLHPDRYNPNANVAAARPIDLLPDPVPTPDEPIPDKPVY